MLLCSQVAGERLKVTRVKESEVLSLLIETLVDIMSIRFESLLCYAEFGVVWSQVRNE